MQGQSNMINVPKPLVSVVMVPFPAQGHLNQLLHLSHLISSYDIPVHYTGSTTHNRQVKHRLQQGGGTNLGNHIRFHDFELPAYDSPPPNPHSSITTLFPLHLQPLWDASIHLRQPFSELLRELATQSRRIVVIFDSLMAYVVQDVKDIINAESYSFVPCGAFTVFLNLWDTMNHKLPFEIDSDVIPSCNIPSVEGCFTPEMEKFIAERLHKYAGLENGSIYNTSRVIEGKYLKLIEKLYGKNCYAIGPFNPVKVSKPKSEIIQRHKCLEWLDKQEKDSVIYVCFGTMTSMSDEQINELAIGLEKSGQKFIWVLRDADKGDVFTVDETVRRLELPEGYEERVKNRGIVLREWAPQLQILSHSSTGGFMSHCGWNSCMESISMGVAMATWPMHSDQPRNALFVAEVLKIGTVVREWSRRSELIQSSDVVRAVTTLLASEEGAEMRRRAVEFGCAVRSSISSGGCSRLEMDSFIAQITR